MSDILSLTDGVSVAVERAEAQGAILLVCEHASARIPQNLGTLGLDEDLQRSHIAWDPGALAVSNMMSAFLDAPLIHQRFSRLVYDCNRATDAGDAIPEVSEVFEIPGNVRLTEVERQARMKAIYVPFHDKIREFLTARRSSGRPCVLATIHSFTPVYNGQQRLTEIGILHDTDDRLANKLLHRLEAESRYVVRRNDPYGPANGVTHTIVEHGVGNGVLNVMIEIRNDLLATRDGQRNVAQYLARILLDSLEDCASDIP